MGRVSRYKKIKSFDPFSSKNNGKINLESVGVWGLGSNGRKLKQRSKTAEKLRAKRKRIQEEPGFDAPPDSDDDFDLNDLTGSIKKRRTRKDELLVDANSKGTVPSQAKVVQKPVKTSIHSHVQDEHLRDARLLKLDKQVDNDRKTKKLDEGRREGESKRAYHRRVKLETREIIKKERMLERNPDKIQRKKEFLNNKKKKKKGGRTTLQEYDDSDQDSVVDTTTTPSTFITGEQAYAARVAATRVQFGEQAERPPVFQQLPRGAASKTNSKKKTAKPGLDDDDIKAEQAEMDRIRRKVQAQYAALRQQRRGEFHL